MQEKLANKKQLKQQLLQQLLDKALQSNLSLRAKANLLQTITQVYYKLIKKIIQSLNDVLKLSLNPAKKKQQIKNQVKDIKTRKRQKVRNKQDQIYNPLIEGFQNHSPNLLQDRQPPATPPRLQLSQTYKQDLLLASQQINNVLNQYPRQFQAIPQFQQLNLQHLPARKKQQYQADKINRLYNNIFQNGNINCKGNISKHIKNRSPLILDQCIFVRDNQVKEKNSVQNHSQKNTIRQVLNIQQINIDRIISSKSFQDLKNIQLQLIQQGRLQTTQYHHPQQKRQQNIQDFISLHQETPSTHFNSSNDSESKDNISPDDQLERGLHQLTTITQTNGELSKTPTKKRRQLSQQLSILVKRYGGLNSMCSQKGMNPNLKAKILYELLCGGIELHQKQSLLFSDIYVN